MSEESIYNPHVSVVLKHRPYSEESTVYVLSAADISSKLKTQENRINTLTGYMSYVKELLTEKLEANEGAEFDELVELAQSIDHEVTREVSVKVNVDFEIEIEMPVWKTVQELEDVLEFDLSSDGSITYVSIQDVEEM